MHNGTYNVSLVSVRVWFWMQSRWVVLGSWFSILIKGCRERSMILDHLLSKWWSNYKNKWSVLTSSEKVFVIAPIQFNQVPSSNRWKRRPHVHIREINMLAPYKIKRRYKLQTLKNMIIGLIDWFKSICSVDWKILTSKMKLNLSSMNF